MPAWFPSGCPVKADINELQAYHKKTRYCVEKEIMAVAKRYGPEYLFFMTPTFGEDVSKEEAARRWNSLNTNFLSKRGYKDTVMICERTALTSPSHGRPHYHLVGKMPFACKTRVNWEEIKAKNFNSLPLTWQAEWRAVRARLPDFHFGYVCEIHPCKGVPAQLARYVVKYVAKHIGQRWECDRGKRFVSWLWFEGRRCFRPSFAWNSRGGWLWRKKLGKLAAMIGIEDMAGMAAKFGKRWCWHLKESIVSVDLPMGRAELAGFNPEWLQKWIEEDNPNVSPFAGACLCPPAVSLPAGTVSWFASS
jgi:hypothetical protein